MIEVPVAVQPDPSVEPGTPGQVQVRRVNLNMNLSEEELNAVHVDRALAEQLLRDHSDRAARPFVAPKGFHTTGSAAAHALDRKVPIKGQEANNTYNLLKKSSPSKSKP